MVDITSTPQLNSPDLPAETLLQDPSTPLPPYQWHLLLCADQTKPKCCSKEAGLDSWEYLKKRLKDLHLDVGSYRVHRTKANCLRGCDYLIPGPILLIYPGSFWYQSVTPEVVERILQEHIMGGIPVQDYLVAKNTLTDPVQN